MEINNKNFSGIPMGKDLDKCIPTETSVRSAEHTG